jgi:cobalt/nickel transport system permease protein
VHIPDGFIDTKIALTSGLISIAAVTMAVRKVRASVPPRAIPMMGLSAAFVFAAQMLNFPVAAGTSGHLLGAVLCAVLLGPYAAVLVMTAVLVVQSLLFADGGLLALGANIFNLALVAPLVGYWIYRLIRRLFTGHRGMLASAAFAAWCSTVVAAISCAGQLAWSGTAPWGAVFPAMTTVHMLIGLGEGLITALVLAAISRVRPDLLTGSDGGPLSRFSVPIALAIVLGLAIFVSPFASSWPDGLDMAARAIGFDHRATTFAGPMADYRIPGVGSPAAATALAAGIGTIVAFLLALLLAKILVPGGKPESTDT